MIRMRPKLLIAGLLFSALLILPAANAASAQTMIPHPKASAAVLASDPNAEIIASWTDFAGKSIFVRVGTIRPDGSGFGMAKIISKHGILNWTSVRWITQNPYSGDGGGYQTLYNAWANEIFCNAAECWVNQSIQVRALMNRGTFDNYYDVQVDGVLGIQTAYCNGPDLCPPWVNLALSNASSRSTDGPVQSTIWSYEPIEAGTVVSVDEVEANQAEVGIATSVD